MGIFSKLFGSSSSIEKQLEEKYVPMLQTMLGMSLPQAVYFFNTLLQQAKREAQKEGTLDLPLNFGDILLKKEATDEKIRSILAKKRKEGVKDEDIRWWWNMHDLERRMMLKIDDIFRLALFAKLVEEDGLTKEEAAKRVRKLFPIFGDPDDTTHSSGDDRPLPYELKDRINNYTMKRSMLDPERYKKEIEESSSFNALIRKEIRKGNL
jgi:hypothetical protein